mmetsp:Transcript_11478/g.20631  ORF Transcript_11478/g.20631 Transcript_11478/m.20631 type:complete len:195 (-) Transcript_11478:234-818(-)|eukprot:CAMPEP_0201599202 /NCGR_PEP_ID=MMETSP0492-20130828/758_1 /ASSEMBLY_ACC=CAM_ASM_000837 /TAXON_ID=420259 /ORGANISM="Thalassiosira gravida, Strain GMp14c1" /LENGTH=194 /DNA_ID=CAMNT_0048061753 /DNA_START=67 /DNA_END=651 /DNA_ORIENTATION=-
MIHRLVTARSIRSLVTCSEALSTRSVSRAGFSSLSPTTHHAIAINNSTITTQQQSYRRNLSSSDTSSHDDFSPQKKKDLTSSPESTILDLIESHVKSNRVMLYMKGSPSQPQCGFSATVVQILKSTGADFSSVNVLDYPELREGVKKYAQWPTIPQLYVDGEFVGGCDIIQSMDTSGELKELLTDAGSEEKKED